MGRTLIEWLTDKVSGKKAPEPVVNERKYYNPLKLKIGSSVTLNDYRYRDLDLSVSQIREVKLDFARSDEYPMVDYDLLARPIGGDPVKLRLRLAPREDADAASGLTHDALLLKFDDELGADKGLEENVLNDGSGEFNVDEDDDGKDDSFFKRREGCVDPYHASVTVLNDKNGDGTVSDDEVRSLPIDFWDYERITQSVKVLKNGSWVDEQLPQPVREFLFVEKDKNKSWFTI